MGALRVRAKRSPSRGVSHQAVFVSRRELGVDARYRVPEPSTFELLELMRAGLAREVAVAREALDEGRGPAR